MFDRGTEEIKMVAEMVGKFAQKELREGVEQADHYPDAPFIGEVVEKARAEGLLSLVLPEESGGMGSLAALGAALYEVGQVCAAFGAILLTQTAAQRFVLAAGTKEMQKRLLGGPELFSFPLYDEIPDWGAGVEARKVKGGGYVLDGEARFMPLSPLAGHLLLAARTGGKLIVCVLPKRVRGLKVGPPLATLGLRACPVADVTLKGCRVGKADILAEGEEAEGLLNKETLRLFGPVIALGAGIAVGSYREALEYAKERYQGGREIAGHQQVRVMLAEMAADARRGLEAAAALCAAEDEGHAAADVAARSAFIQATDAAARSCVDGVQLLGCCGYMQDYGQERRMRDSKQVQLLLGRNDVHRLALMEEEIGG